MQITISDALIKQMLVQHVENVSTNTDPSVIDAVFFSPVFQNNLSLALSKRFEQEADVILDILQELEI